MFYISISNGLLEGKHQAKMGSAVWQYMWLIDKVTKIDEQGVGWVLGGKPIKLEELAIHITRDAVSRNLKKLEKEGYIKIKHAPYGLIITVMKAKKRFGNNIEPTSTKRSNLYGQNIEPNKTVSVDSISKTIPETVISEPFMENTEPKFYEEMKDGKIIQVPILAEEVKEKNPNSMAKLLAWAVLRRSGANFTAPKKQYSAMSRMNKAGIKPYQIKERWIELEDNRFWQDKLDFTSVAISFDQKPYGK